MVYRSPISRHVKLDALAFCSQGYNNCHSSNVFGISKRAIQRSRKRLRVYGDIEGGRRKRGRKPKLTTQWLTYITLRRNLIVQLLVKQVFSNPTGHLAEYCKVFEEEFGIKFSTPSMSRLRVLIYLWRKSQKRQHNAIQNFVLHGSKSFQSGKRRN